MSYAINRKEIQDVVFLGTGMQRQAAPLPRGELGKKEWEDHCASYDPDKAKSLLDEMGLKELDADGFRKRKDGTTLELNIEYTTNIDLPAAECTRPGGSTLEGRRCKDEFQGHRPRPVVQPRHNQRIDGRRPGIRTAPTNPASTFQHPASL